MKQEAHRSRRNPHARKRPSQRVQLGGLLLVPIAGFGLAACDLEDQAGETPIDHNSSGNVEALAQIGMDEFDGNGDAPGQDPGLAPDDLAIEPQDTNRPGDPDFDRDGYADIAVGVPGEDHGNDPDKKDLGAVLFLYGGPGGFERGGGRVEQLLPKHANSPGAHFGAALVWGDFNGDGREDLAVSATFADVSGPGSQEGLVEVYFGGCATGICTTGSQVLHGSVEGEHYGFALAAGDINGDGIDDLAVGAPRADVGSSSQAGRVEVFHGSTGSNPLQLAMAFDQGTSGVAGALEPGDGYGASLTIGDLNCDGRGDLAIGSANEAVGSTEGAGAVSVLYGTSNGLTTSGDIMFHQNSSGVGGTANTFNAFGKYLVAADFTGDGCDDLAVGAPIDRNREGSVSVFYGSNQGIQPADSHYSHQDLCAIGSPGGGCLLGPGHGAPIPGDMFGFSLAAGDTNWDGFDDLIVGAPGKGGKGAATILLGSASQLNYTGHTMALHQDLPEVPGSAESNDQFGWVVAFVDLLPLSRPVVVFGVPREDYGTEPDVGTVNPVVLDALGGGRPELDYAEGWVSNQLGGARENFDLMGAAISDRQSQTVAFPMPDLPPPG